MRRVDCGKRIHRSVTNLTGDAGDIRRRVGGEGGPQRGGNLRLVLLEERVASIVCILGAAEHRDHILQCLEAGNAQLVQGRGRGHERGADELGDLGNQQV